MNKYDVFLEGLLSACPWKAIPCTDKFNTVVFDTHGREIAVFHCSLDDARYLVDVINSHWKALKNIKDEFMEGVSIPAKPETKGEGNESV